MSADEPERTPRPHEDEPEWRRRARLARIFGDVLPETTADERDPSRAGQDSEEDPERASERWLKSQVPPHHGE